MELITDCLLNGFVLSNYASRKTGFPRAANLSDNLYIKPGDVSLESLIRGLIGILIKGLGTGTMGILGVAKNSFFF